MKTKKNSKISVKRSPSADVKTSKRQSSNSRKKSLESSTAISESLKLSERIQMKAYALGNSFEVAAKRLQNNGYSKLGTKVEWIGDVIDYMGDLNGINISDRGYL
jgi:hypothetical protein